ncbi:MAG: hypothetical protein RTU92_04400 [Candidatus Thorarchaeota archaeon]
MAGGCTLAAKTLGGRMFLLKNKDLVYEEFQDTAVIDDTFFAITGVDIATSDPIGASIGFNKWGLAACSSTVLITDDQPYDSLLEEILKTTRDIDEANSLVIKRIEEGNRYQWCNIVLSTPSEVGVLEVGDGICNLERDSRMIVRTNHHLRLHTMEIIRNSSDEVREAAGPLHTSENRRQVAAKKLYNAASLGDMIDLLSTHSSSRGYDSICRHKSEPSNLSPFQGQTVYSYIVEITGMQIDDLDFRIHVARGPPCIDTYKEVVIGFDMSPEDRALLLKDIP